MSSILSILFKIMLDAPQLLPLAYKMVEDAIHGPGGVGKVEEVVADLEALLAEALKAGA
jgi:hypothetical protein